MCEETTTPMSDAVVSGAEPSPENELSGSLKYEHVHRIEITITLLTGVIGRRKKQR